MNVDEKREVNLDMSITISDRTYDSPLWSFRVDKKKAWKHVMMDSVRYIAARVIYQKVEEIEFV
jgi:hypothetical protein